MQATLFQKDRPLSVVAHPIGGQYAPKCALEISGDDGMVFLHLDDPAAVVRLGDQIQRLGIRLQCGAEQTDSEQLEEWKRKMEIDLLALGVPANNESVRP